MAQGSVVNFPAFRLHEAARKEANNAIMGLLVGSQMAAHFLSLTAGSAHLLPSMFPAVSHVGRFNLTSDRAREVLVRADTHLGTMAVPYALAIHEEFLRACMWLAGGNRDLVAGKLHGAFSTSTGGVFDVDPMAQFHLLREMRNALIHTGGTADHRIVACVKNLSHSAETSWKRLVGRSPRNLNVGDRVELGAGELFLTLAVAKNLARQANRLLVPALSASRWADLIVDDFIEHGPADVPRGDRLKKLRGWARFNYGPVSADDRDLVDASSRCGLQV